jgi:hypothetical protein
MAADASVNQQIKGNTRPYEIESFVPFDSFNFDIYSGNYPKLVEFVKDYFATKKHLFNPLKSLYDPFIQGTTSPRENRKTYTDFYQWYIEKNPDFGSIAELNIPEYKLALVQMCRDLLFLHSRGKYFLSNNARRKTNNLRKTKRNGIITRSNINTLINKEINDDLTTNTLRKTYGITKINNNGKGKINNLLGLIESKLPSEAYIYVNFIEILYHFLQIMGFNHKSTKNSYIPVLDRDFEMFKIFFLKMPILIYPTYMQIDFKVVLLLYTSPIVNFRLSNRFRFIHEDNLPPISEIEHDVLFHAERVYKFHLNGNDSKKHNFKMNKFIQLLKPHFDYDEKDTSIYLEQESNENILVISEETKIENAIIISDNKKKICFCLLLFQLIHERYMDYYSFKEYLNQFNTLNDLFEAEFGNKKRVIRFYSATNIFKENDENKACEKLPFTKYLYYKNIFYNFAKLLFSLKTHIIAIEDSIII